MDLLKGWNGVYFLIAAVIAGGVLERFIPWRRMPFDPWRWARAGLLSVYGVILVAAIPFVSDFALAFLAEKRDVGLFNMIGAPAALSVPATIVVVDAIAFSEHVLLHRVSLLWRLHRAHHSDVMVDASTALRFHPFETLFRAAFEAPFVLALGLPPEGLLAAFVVLSVVNVYTHFNVPLPRGLERALAPVLVTPRMHRLHHTTDGASQRLNYGTMFSFWDRLARTRAGPDALADDAAFGLEAPEAPPRESFGQLLLDPFRTPRPGEQ